MLTLSWSGINNSVVARGSLRKQHHDENSRTVRFVAVKFAGSGGPEVSRLFSGSYQCAEFKKLILPVFNPGQKQRSNCVFGLGENTHFRCETREWNLDFAPIISRKQKKTYRKSRSRETHRRHGIMAGDRGYCKVLFSFLKIFVLGLITRFSSMLFCSRWLNRSIRVWNEFLLNSMPICGRHRRYKLLNLRNKSTVFSALFAVNQTASCSSDNIHSFSIR